MALATVNDVRDAMRRDLDEEEVAFSAPMLDFVEAQIQTRMPDAIARAATDEAHRTLLVHIEAEAAARVLRAPAAGVLKYEIEGTYTYSVNNAVASGLLGITDDEWNTLRKGARGWGGSQPVMDGYVRERRTPLLNGMIYTSTAKFLPQPSRLDIAGVVDLSDGECGWGL